MGKLIRTWYDGFCRQHVLPERLDHAIFFCSLLNYTIIIVCFMLPTESLSWFFMGF
jgi:hypothetical protein